MYCVDYKINTTLKETQYGNKKTCFYAAHK